MGAEKWGGRVETKEGIGLRRRRIRRPPVKTCSTVNVATLKAHAEEFIAKAIAGEPTVIEQNGKRAVLLPCEGIAPDLELDPETEQEPNDEGS